jgi:hypothetical protein
VYGIGGEDIQGFCYAVLEERNGLADAVQVSNAGPLLAHVSVVVENQGSWREERRGWRCSTQQDGLWVMPCPGSLVNKRVMARVGDI